MIRFTGLLALALMLLPPVARASDATAGVRKTIAVGGFESADTGGATNADGLSAMLTAALLKDDHFVLVERQAMAQIQWERQAAQSGNTASTAPSGQLIGASVLVRGTVTKFDPHSGGGGVSLGGFGLFGGHDSGSIGVESQTAVVEIALRLIDTATGRVIASSSASGTASAKGFDASLYQRRGLSVGVSGFSETPMGKACEQAIDKAVTQIDQTMAGVPWSSSIVENTGDQVYVAGGTDQNMQTGTTLHVYRKVRDLTDPVTGAVLETITAPVGTIQLREVHDSVSVAAVLDGGPPMRGDIVRLK